MAVDSSGRCNISRLGVTNGTIRRLGGGTVRASTDAIAWSARCQPAGGETGVPEVHCREDASEAAASACGVSQPLGPRWFREAGGIPPISLVPHSGRYLSFAEREEIALLKAQRCGVREIARQLGRSPSTISRQLRRNAAIRSGSLQYRATVAQWKVERVTKRPKLTKPAENERLPVYVQDRLAGGGHGCQGQTDSGIRRAVEGAAPWPARRLALWHRWNPLQISRRLRIDFSHDASVRISHEAIYHALCRTR